MEPGAKLRTVFGFNCGLDWRPTVFYTDFPPIMTCSACGLACSITGVFPCVHVLCQRCFSRCAEWGRCQCPIDCRVYKQDEVGWFMHSRQSLLSYQIRCWNAHYGCDAAGPASEILDHFQFNCQYYGVTCRRCRRTVVQKEVVGHLSSGSCAQDQLEAAPTPEDSGAVSSTVVSGQETDHEDAYELQHLQTHPQATDLSRKKDDHR